MTRHLFIDRQHVHRTDGVERVFHQPVKHPRPVLEPDQAWEGARVKVWSAPVWCEERKRWRMWYIGGDALLPLYAESADGIHWEKPTLELREHEGHRRNNLIDLGFTPKGAKENRIVMLRDPYPADARQTFKGLTLVDGTMHSLTSADGLTWHPLEGDRTPSDDEYRLGYDAHHRRFVATVKLGGWKGRVYGATPEFGRAVSLSLSDDFVRWTEPRMIFWADEVDQQLGRDRIEAAMRDRDQRGPIVADPDQYFTDVYNMPVFTYEDLYLALPVMFHQSGAYFLGEKFSNQDGILHPALAASRDLVTWDRLDRSPFIDRSPLSDTRLYDQGAIYANAPVLHGEELRFYYTGTRLTHVKPDLARDAGVPDASDPRQSGVFVAKLRRDGFASMYAGPAGGVVLTRPVTVDGDELHVNADALGGELRVEVRDAESGRVIPGFGLGDYVKDRRVHSPDGKRDRPRMGTGARYEEDPLENDTVPMSDDTTDAVVRWRGREGVGSLKGRQVRRYFYLRRAHLYAFWFAH